MNFYKPRNLSDLFKYCEETEGKKYFLAGGSDINVQLKNKMITDGTVFYINHLKELHGIRVIDDEIVIGALTTFRELISSDIIAEYLPYFQSSLMKFGSPLLQNVATLGGNIANGSPTADAVPLLLVLDARVRILAKSKMHKLPLSDFYLGYKKFNVKPNEIIGSVHIPKAAERGWQKFYRKLGARKSLAIAKLSLAGMKRIENGGITDIKLAAGSLNEYPRRLNNVEDFIKGTVLLRTEGLRNSLAKDITPISDMRSDKDYRFEVCYRLLTSFLENIDDSSL